MIPKLKLLGRHSRFQKRSTVKIYGERNTGTNVLSVILRSGHPFTLLPGTVAEVSPQHYASIDAQVSEAGLSLPESVLLKETLIDTFFHERPDLLGWKHREVRFEDISKARRENDTVLVVTVKDPYSWALSLFRNPYHQLSFGAYSTLQEFVSKPWISVRREGGAPIYANVCEIWNAKVRSYLEVSQHIPTLFVRFEDLLASPREALKGLQVWFPAMDIDNISLPEASTKDAAKKAADYQDYYLKERWVEELDPQVTGVISGALDRRLVEAFDYHIR